jgi:hypothetical protein
MYANNEPVETPWMAEQRQAAEQSEADEQTLQETLETARVLAAGYNFDKAIALLNSLSSTTAMDQRVLDARRQYEQGDSVLINWENRIPHLCFPTLIEDTSLAFDGDSSSESYKSSMMTTGEFKAILESLYRKDYILIDIHDIAGLVTAGDSFIMQNKTIKVPQDRKPIILSQDNLNYANVKSGDGIAQRLVLDAEGCVKAEISDQEGHSTAGDYDFIPILDSFIREHPDFSFRGARGIVSVSGSEGIFGYKIPENMIRSSGSGSEGLGNGLAGLAVGGISLSEEEEESSMSESTDFSEEGLSDSQIAVKRISSALTEEGWRIACCGWSHVEMNDVSMSTATFQEEIDKWENNVGSLTGKADIVLYPYGAEVTYPSDKLSYLTSHGFVYLCGLWGDTDYRELGRNFLRQTRRFVDGYSVNKSPDTFLDFFNASEIMSKDR